jgi:hypothetical protein
VSDWQELLAGHLLTCIESQVRLADIIGEKRWSVDVPGGVISFAGGPSYRADLVGSASAEQGTWLWAWANPHLPESTGAASGRLRRYGEEHAIGLLTTRSLPLGEPPDGIDPHLAGLIATPLLDGDAYFLAENGPQTVALVLHDPALRLGPLTGPDLRSTLLSGIGMYGTDHRVAVRSYITGRGAELAGNGPEWMARTADGQQTQLTFDELGRLDAMNATLKADPPASRARRFWRR